MSILSERLRLLRKNNKLTQKEVAEYLDMTESGYGYYEQNRNQPSLETLSKLAEKYNVSVAYLTGETNEPKPVKKDLPSLTPKDERDIAKDLEKIINNLENPNDGYAAYDGQTLDDMDEEDRELLIAALEQSMRIAKQIAKKKYTPKKYRKED